jgi:hypothetical protein
MVASGLHQVARLLYKYKRPAGQNLWGRDKSVLDFELEVAEVVSPAGGLTRLRFQSFSG